MAGPGRRVERIRAVGGGPELPVYVHSAGSGPVSAVTAAIHGDELVGFAAALALDRMLPGLLRAGRVALYPTVNPEGVAARTRVFPTDHADLNRCFPGSATGAPSARHCAAVFADLAARQPDLVVDLHCDSPAAIPYAVIDRAVAWRPDREFEARMLALARATGFAVLHDYPPEAYVKSRLDRSLAGAVFNTLRTPALTLEVGARRALDPAAVDLAVRAVLGVLAERGHLDPPAGHVPWAGPVRVRANAPRTRYAGVFVPALPPGAAFARGEPLGVVVSAEGEALETVAAEAAGVVVAWIDGAWVEAGGVPGAVGLEERDA